MTGLEAVQIDLDKGLEGDRFSGRTGNPRQVTLIQQEHLAVIAACLGQESIDPSLLRRNIVVSGINLLALKDTAMPYWSFPDSATPAAKWNAS